VVCHSRILVQEGSIGLMRAADLFDWTMGNEFSTFAGLRIIAACQRAIENQAETIRIPVHTRSSGRCAPEVERAKRVMSGNKPMAKDHHAMGRETELFDLIKSSANTEDEALSAVAADETAGAIATALLMLNPQERAIIEARYLSGSSEPVTQGAVGKQLGISKQRVEQVQKVAMAKMRAALQGVADVN
jgi:RNA polymerase sigma factor (sigma-70 family)